MKTIIIDDEIKAIELFEYYLTDFFDDFEITGKYTTIKDGLQHVNNQDIDVLFLDINMPNGTGLDLLNLIEGKNICTVFVTAHSEYAIDAIKLSAFDYLLKPINISELNRVHSKLTHYLKESKLTSNEKKITIKISSSHYIFDTKDITHISSEGNYTTIHSTTEKPLLISKNLKKVEEDYFYNLPFFRCHQSHIININQVKEYNTYELVLTDNSKVPISSKKHTEFIDIQKNRF
jgi:two-component system LytT family response regulator